jgi:hypothetical protein
MVRSETLPLQRIYDFDLTDEGRMAYVGLTESWRTVVGWAGDSTTNVETELDGASGVRVVGHWLAVVCATDRGHKVVLLDQSLRERASVLTSEIADICVLGEELVLALEEFTYDHRPAVVHLRPEEGRLHSLSGVTETLWQNPVRGLVPGPGVAWAWSEVEPRLYPIVLRGTAVAEPLEVPAVLGPAERLAYTGRHFLASILTDECWTWRPSDGGFRRHLLDGDAWTEARPHPDGLVLTTRAGTIAVHRLVDL